MRMSLPVRYAALAATLAIVTVALCPAGAGPFTATCGPVTAMRAVADIAIEFILISLLPAALISRAESYVQIPVWAVAASGSDHPSTLTLRC